MLIVPFLEPIFVAKWLQWIHEIGNAETTGKIDGAVESSAMSVAIDITAIAATGILV